MNDEYQTEANAEDEIAEQVQILDQAEGVADGEAPAAEDMSLEERLAAAEARAEEYLDGWQRARAEFANARKRMERERRAAYQNARVDILAELLPTLDDYERALETVPEAIAAHSWYEGIQLVYRKLRGLLEKEKIEPIAAVGEQFDPQVHEAVMQEPSDEYESGVIVRELQTGYRVGDRVIRPALVVVAA